MSIEVAATLATTVLSLVIIVLNDLRERRNRDDRIDGHDRRIAALEKSPPQGTRGVPPKQTYPT